MAKKMLLRRHQDLSPQEQARVISFYKKNTAAQTAAMFGLENTSGFATWLNREFPKKMGHGGARAGSGNVPADAAKAKAVAALLQKARSVGAMAMLPADVSAENAEAARVEAANVLRATIAAIKEIITAIEAA